MNETQRRTIEREIMNMQDELERWKRLTKSRTADEIAVRDANISRLRGKLYELESGL